MIKRLFFVLAIGTITIAGCNNSEAKSVASADNNPVEKSTTTSEPSEGGKAIHITKAEFLSKIFNYVANPDTLIYLGDKPCVIDFYADWCGPCKIASPVLDELAKEYKDEIYVYKVNTEVERELAGDFGIRSIPTFIFFPVDGRPVMSSGIARTPEETKQMFAQMIDEILLGKKTQESL